MREWAMPLAALILSFGFLAPWGGVFVRALLARGIGKQIRYDGPQSHQAKSGTATMGGTYFLVGISLCAWVLLIVWREPVVLAVWLSMIVQAGVGAFDDLQGLKDTSGYGWLAGKKFLVQWGVAVAIALGLYLLVPALVCRWPDQRVGALGPWAIPLSILLLVGTSNAVNLSDGLDGLASGLCAIAYGCFGLLCLLSGQIMLSSLCFGVVGSLMAFLWFNVHPARMFMGDVGSEALGAGLAAVAILSGYWWLLPLVGFVFLAVTISVMLQVSWFKYTRRRYGEGRRLLRMAPLHHHFEMLGWSEVQVTLRFWIAGALSALLALLVVARW